MPLVDVEDFRRIFQELILIVSRDREMDMNAILKDKRPIDALIHQQIHHASYLMLRGPNHPDNPIRVIFNARKAAAILSSAAILVSQVLQGRLNHVHYDSDQFSRHEKSLYSHPLVCKQSHSLKDCIKTLYLNYEEQLVYFDLKSPVVSTPFPYTEGADIVFQGVEEISCPKWSDSAPAWTHAPMALYVALFYSRGTKVRAPLVIKNWIRGILKDVKDKSMDDSSSLAAKNAIKRVSTLLWTAMERLVRETSLDFYKFLSAGALRDDVWATLVEETIQQLRFFGMDNGDIKDRILYMTSTYTYHLLQTHFPPHEQNGPLIGTIGFQRSGRSQGDEQVPASHKSSWNAANQKKLKSIVIGWLRKDKKAKRFFKDGTQTGKIECSNLLSPLISEVSKALIRDRSSAKRLVIEIKADMEKVKKGKSSDQGIAQWKQKDSASTTPSDQFLHQIESALERSLTADSKGCLKEFLNSLYTRLPTDQERDLSARSKTLKDGELNAA